MGPRVYQPPASATSAPPSPSVLCFPSRYTKNTPSLGVSRLLPTTTGGPLPCQARAMPSLREASKGDPPASPGGPLPRP